MNAAEKPSVIDFIIQKKRLGWIWAKIRDAFLHRCFHLNCNGTYKSIVYKSGSNVTHCTDMNCIHQFKDGENIWVCNHNDQHVLCEKCGPFRHFNKQPIVSGLSSIKSMRRVWTKRFLHGFMLIHLRLSILIVTII